MNLCSAFFKIAEDQRLREFEPINISLKEFILQTHPIMYGVEFCWCDFHDILEDVYTKVAHRELPHTLTVINLPPRSSKTLFMMYHVAWCFLHNPRARFVYATYSQKLSEKISAEIMRILSIHKNKIKLARAGVKLWETNKGGGFWSTSMGGSVTGAGTGDLYGTKFGGDLLIDDPQNPASAFYEVQREFVKRAYLETFWSRRDNQDKIPIIVNQQRVHVDDLSGHLLRSQPKLQHVCIKALNEKGESFFPQRISTQELLDYKEASPYAFWSQQMQEPKVYAGGFFNVEKLAIMSVEQYNKVAWHLKFFVRSWDLAGVKKISMSNIERRDFTRGVLLGTDGKVVYIMDLKTHKGTVEGNELLIAETAKKDGFQVMITVPEDPGVAGQHYVDYLQKSPKLLGYSLNAVRPTQNKQLRAAPFASYLNLGKVVLVSDSEDDEKWNDDIVEELQSFPTGCHDDIIDALSDAFHIIHDVKSFV